MIANNKPYLEIIEQPGPTYYRNESELEKEKHGCIQGKSNDKTVPTVKVHNAEGKMTLKVTPLNPENGQLHFTRLARQDRQSLSEEILDPCSFELTKDNSYTVKLKLAIMIPRKNSEFLRPGIDKNLGKMVLNFELFDENGEKVDEIKSDAFGNKRNKLEIRKIKVEKGSVEGGLEIWIACSRFQLKNNDIQVRFSKDNWESHVKVDEAYNQDVLIIQSPPYCNQNITEPVTVDVQLKNQIDGALSEKFQFTYQPRAQAIKRCGSPIESCETNCVKDTSEKENDELTDCNCNLNVYDDVKRRKIDNTTQTSQFSNCLKPLEYNTNLSNGLSIEGNFIHNYTDNAVRMHSESVNSNLYSENISDMKNCFDNIIRSMTKEELLHILEQIVVKNDNSNLLRESDSNQPSTIVSENGGYSQNFVQDVCPEFQIEPIQYSLETFDNNYLNN